MPEKVVLLDSWIEAHFEELYGMWQEACGKGDVSAAPASAQKNDSATPASGQKNNSAQKNDSAAEPKEKNSKDSEIHPAIAKGLKDGTILKYDKRNQTIKLPAKGKWREGWMYVDYYLSARSEWCWKSNIRGVDRSGVAD